LLFREVLRPFHELERIDRIAGRGVRVRLITGASAAVTQVTMPANVSKAAIANARMVRI